MVPGSLPLLKRSAAPHGEGLHYLKNFLLYVFNGQASLNQAQVHSFSSGFNIDDNTLFILDHYTLFPFFDEGEAGLRGLLISASQISSLVSL